MSDEPEVKIDYTPGLRNLLRGIERIRREVLGPPYVFPPLPKEEPEKREG